MYRWNDAIRALDDERFIAFTILELRESTSLLRIAPAGNPHPIVFRGPTGAAIEIASHGMPLGLLDREEWRPPTWQELTLTPDAAVICVTDGISDTRVRHSPDRFGLSGILAAFQNQPEHNATRLRQEFLDRTDNARLQEDDITVVSIERLPRIAA
jgi:serine phosphatase RsbU (regulator of sigma subunit)